MLLSEQVTILIPTKNRANDLQASLARMRDSGYGELPFVIYDDGSADPEATCQATECLKNVTVVYGEKSRGQAYGRNRLLEQCRTPFALLTDDDTFFLSSPDVLAELIARDLYFSGIGRADAVCAQVVRSYDRVLLFPGLEGTRQIVSPVGMGLLVRTDVMRKLKGFRDFFVYRHEESELGLRLWAYSHIVVATTEIFLEHVHTPAGRSSKQYDYLTSRNLILMHFLDLPGIHGLPTGVLRAMRLFFRLHVHYFSLLQGFVTGLIGCWRYRGERSVMSLKRYRALVEFRRKLQ